MALHATNPGVRRVIVRHVLRLHHGMAEFAAEARRVRELIGAIAANRAQQDEDEDKADEEHKASSMFRPVQVDPW